MLSDSNFDEGSSGSEEQETTKTSIMYEEIMKDPNFLLTMQPRMFEEVDSEEEIPQDEYKTDSIQMDPSVLGESQRSLMQENIDNSMDGEE